MSPPSRIRLLASRIHAFVSELRRRRVIRVGVVYLVSAWVVAQVAVVVFPHLNLPAWSITLVIVLAILGFPIAVSLAWAFHVGSRGVIRTGAPPGPEAVEREEGGEPAAEGPRARAPSPSR